MKEASCLLRGLYGLEFLSWGFLFLIDVITIPSQLSLGAASTEALWLGVVLTIGCCLLMLAFSLRGLIRGTGLAARLGTGGYIALIVMGLLARFVAWTIAIVWVTTVNGMQSV